MNFELIGNSRVLHNRFLPALKESNLLLQRDKIRAAYISKQPSKHFPYMMDCLRRGLHVLVEKPLVLDPYQRDELFAEAVNRGLVVMESFPFLYHPQWKLVQELQPKKHKMFMTATFYAPVVLERWRLDPKEWGCIGDFAVYGLAAAIDCKNATDVSTIYVERTTRTPEGVSKSLAYDIDFYDGSMLHMTCGYSDTFVSNFTAVRLDDLHSVILRKAFNPRQDELVTVSSRSYMSMPSQMLGRHWTSMLGHFNDLCSSESKRLEELHSVMRRAELLWWLLGEIDAYSNSK